MKILRLTSLLCSALLILSACHTTTSPPPLSSDSGIVVVDVTKYSEIYETYMQFRHLTAAEQTAYGIIYTAVQDHFRQETIIQNEAGESVPGIRVSLTTANLTVQQISRTFEAFLQDNPAFHFIDRTYSLEGHETHGTKRYETLALYYTMDAAQRNTTTQQLRDAIQSIVNGCPVTDDHYVMELYLHDQLLSFCTYDQAAAEHPSLHSNAYTAYGALVEGKAVCEGYAKAMQMLLTTVAIPATTVRGYSADNQTGHMWNLVQINAEFYYLDPTWNDGEKQYHYTYFNITSETLRQTHIIDANALFSTTCTATANNYFIRNNTFISSYDRDDIAVAIAAQMKAGATAVHLRFADGKYENALLFLKNSALTKKMVNSHLPEGMLMWDYELISHGKQNTLSIHKR